METALIRDEEALHGSKTMFGKWSVYLPEFVYGWIDGIVTTFAVVAWATWANLDISIVLILGFANLFADGFSMSVWSYLSKKSEQAEYERQKSIEEREVDYLPDRERDEIREIYAAKWFEWALLDQVVEVITADKARRVDVMMKEELEMSRPTESPMTNWAVTLVSFIVVWLFPLVAYIFYYLWRVASTHLFTTAIVVTGLAFICIWWLKSYVTNSHIARSIGETLLLWLLAAFVAYYVGDVLEIVLLQ